MWYLDDSTVAGTRFAVSEFLSQVDALGPSLGLFLNRMKCELFGPSGDVSFPGFPLEIHEPFDGLDLLRRFSGV